MVHVMGRELGRIIGTHGLDSADSSAEEGQERRVGDEVSNVGRLRGDVDGGSVVGDGDRGLGENLSELDVGGDNL